MKIPVSENPAALQCTFPHVDYNAVLENSARDLVSKHCNASVKSFRQVQIFNQHPFLFSILTRISLYKNLPLIQFAFFIIWDALMINIFANNTQDIGSKIDKTNLGFLQW